jgi:hypothetical protein
VNLFCALHPSACVGDSRGDGGGEPDKACARRKPEARSETMSILSSVTSILGLIKIPGIGVPREECEPTKPDDCGNGKHSKWNDDHQRRDDYSKDGDKDKDDYSKLSGKDDYSKRGEDDYSKHAKNDDGSDDGRNGDYSKHAGKDDYSKDGKGDYSKLDGGWKDAKNDDCQPQKDYCDPKPSDDCGKGDTYHYSGEALAKFDFSHGDFSSHGPDHSGDMQSALASMSSDDALEYAIGQMGPADHFDVGHFDVPPDMSHDTDA